MCDFKVRHGSIVCREILGCDLNTPAGKAEFTSQNLLDVKCVGCVRDSVQVLEKLL